MEYVFFITGLVIGALLVWFYINYKKGAMPDASNLQQELAVQQSISEERQIKLIEHERNNSVLQKELSIVREEILKKEQTYIQEKQTLKIESQQEREKLEQQLFTEREKNEFLNKRVAKAEEVFEMQKTKIAELNREKEDLNKKLTAEFEVIASKIMEDKSQKFTEQNKINIDAILSPLKDRIKDFETKVDKVYKEDSNERVSLKKEIELLMTLNKQVSEDANNLANALKGDNKLQGNWGEIMLEKILESSGLRKGDEYDTQMSFVEDGIRKQPDVIINLPDSKQIIIDSKVSLVAYELAVNAVTEEDRAKAVKLHVDSLKNHIKLLSEKNYQESAKLNTPEFVLLFVPIESMFSLAIQADIDLFNFAWNKKIVIVSPSTLLATLKTVASIWKQERQTKHALQIAEEGGRLYDKFVGFIADMEKIDVKLSESKRSYDDAMNKLQFGNGNVIRQVQKLKDLGAKATKQLPEKFIDGTTSELL